VAREAGDITQAPRGGTRLRPVAEAIRKQLRRETGQNVEPAEIVRLLKETVIRAESTG